MASMRKNEHGHWVISIQSLGLNTTLSTKTSKKVDATRIQRAIEQRVDRVKLDGKHPYHDWTKAEKRVWIKVGAEPVSDSQEPISVVDAIEGYLGFVRDQNLAFNTIEGYRRDLQAAKDKFGALALSKVTSRHLQEWVQELARTVIKTGSNRGCRLSIKTQKVKVEAFKRVVRHYLSLDEQGLSDRVFDAVRYGVEQPSVCDELTPWVDFDTRVAELVKHGIDPSHERAFKKVFLTEQQQRDQLAYLRESLFDDGTLPSIRLYAAIYLCCTTGARRSEIARIRKQDLTLDGELPELTLLKRKGRGNSDLSRKKVVLPANLVPVLRRHLALHPGDQRCLFTSDDAHLAIDGFIQKAERDKADYLGKSLVDALKGSTWEHAAGWHIYRHTLASRMLAAGYSKTVIKEQVGWCSDEMAERYQHQSMDHKAQIVNSLF